MKASEKNESISSTPFTDQSSLYYQVFQQSSVAQVIVDKDLTIFASNNRMFECFHMKPYEVIGLSFGCAFWCVCKASEKVRCGTCKAAKKCTILKVARNVLLDDLSSVNSVIEYQWRRKNQHGTKWFYIGGVKITSTDTSYAALSFVDITMQKRQEEHLKKKLALDQPTGFMNKQNLLARIDKLVNPNVTKCFTLCMIDFDNFKEINDSCGHLIGDKVLKAFADIARKHIRKYDQVGRFGGEEFVFIFMDSNPHQALHILQRIHNELNLYFNNHIQIPVTFSAGVAYVDTDDNPLDCTDLFLDVDRLLYQAKDKGKSRAVSALGEVIFCADQLEQANPKSPNNEA